MKKSLVIHPFLFAAFPILFPLISTRDTFQLLRDERNHQFDISTYVRRLKTVRTEEFKYIWASDGCDELYNIRLDPEELNNLIDVKPEKARELKALLTEWLNSFELYRPEAAKQVQ